MDLPMVIRTATLNDAASISALTLQLGYNMDEASTQNILKKILNDADHVVLLAEIGEPMAWIHFCLAYRLENLPFCEIVGFIVDEKHRGKGIGKLLLEETKSWCIKRGIPNLRVRSRMMRKDAHRFYLDAGFVEIKEQKLFEFIFK
jgi:GNAT superfamily N-acetyltransferase